MTSLLQASFNAGEISPRTGGRVDLAKYQSALSTCKNALPLPHGGVTRRPGTQYIASCKNANKLARVVPFVYSTEQAYIIEMGDQYARFYMDGGQIQTFDAYTKLCIHPDGKNASQTITDATDNAHTITAYGNAKIDTAQSPFSTGGSIYFDGTGDYLSLADSADWNMGSPTNLVTNGTAWTGASSPGSTPPTGWTDNGGGETYDNSSGGISITSSTTFGGMYQEIAVTSGVQYCFTVTATTIASSPAAVVLIGTTAGASDVGSAIITETSPTKSSIVFTATTSAVFVTLCTAGGDDPVIFDTAMLATSAGASFTFDFWAQRPASGNMMFFQQRADDNNLVQCYYASGTLVFNVKSSSTDRINIAATWPSPTANTWHHVSIVRGWEGNPDTVAVLVDGALLTYGTETGSTGWAYPDLSAALEIGRIYSGGYAYHTGWLAEFRVSKGVARWTAAFTPQSVPYPLSSGSTIYDISTTYLESELAELDFCQSADTLYITHPDHPPAKLTRSGHDDWTLASISFNWPPFLDANATSVTLTPSVTNVGTCTVEASDALFVTTWEGGALNIGSGFLNITSYQSATEVYGTIVVDLATGTSTSYDPVGIVNLATGAGTTTVTWPDHGFSAGDQITLSGVTQTGWEGINGTYTATIIDGNYLTIPVSTLLWPAYDFETDPGKMRRIGIGAASATWAKSAWDGVEGYPSCVTFFEERLCFGGTDGKPQTIWMSVSGDYENFNAKEGTTIADSDSCTYTISSSQVNAIKWLAAIKKLVAGTTDGEWLISGSDAAVTPSSIDAHQDTSHGCSDIQPVRVGNSLLFVQRAGNVGKTIRELGYDYMSDSYKGGDLSILAEHLIRNNYVKEIAFQKIPHQVLWCVRDDGDLIALTYLREHEVVGWSHHETDGLFESVAVIPGTDEDEVWFVVKRTINGSDVRYIERLKSSWTGSSLNDAFYVDCGLSYAGTAATTISGLGHLEGEFVTVSADGAMSNSATVSSGAINIGTAASTVHVGLPITTDIETLRCAPVEVQGKKKRIHNVTLRLYETAGDIYIGPDSARLDTESIGASIFSDDKEGPFRNVYETDGKIFIRKTDALPLTVLAIVPDLESYP